MRYIARTDEVNDDEYVGVFLQKVPSCLKDDYISFTIDEEDDASFFQVTLYSNSNATSSLSWWYRQSS